MERIQDYRQPLVTASGIFLGFMLTFSTVWVQEAFTKHFVRDVIVGISIVTCIILLQIVLYRVLTMNYPVERMNVYYQRTLRLFLIAVTVPFVAFLLVIIRRLVDAQRT
jgi:hypothetical protein